MALNNIWVFAQVANGAPTSGTLELLTKARSLSSNVAAFVVIAITTIPIYLAYRWTSKSTEA